MYAHEVFPGQICKGVLSLEEVLWLRDLGQNQHSLWGETSSESDAVQTQSTSISMTTTTLCLAA